MANIYLEIGQINKAEEFLKNAIRIKQDCFEAYKILSNLYKQVERLEESKNAIPFLKTIIKSSFPIGSVAFLPIA